MAAAHRLAFLLIGSLVADGQGSSAPVYSAESVANTAANIAGYYTPNTFLTIYGDKLALATRAIAPEEIRGGVLPTTLIGTGVRVLVNLVPVAIYFASSTQVNLLLPPTLGPGRATLQLVRDGVAGPAVSINLTSSASAFFQSDDKTVVATHADGTVVTAAAPAHRGETIVLWGDGLGPTNPEAPSGMAALYASQIVDKPNLRLLLNGTPVDLKRIPYAGLTPGFAGLYQVNVQLPDDAPLNPEIRIGIGDQVSPAGKYLPLE